MDEQGVRRRDRRCMRREQIWYILLDIYIWYKTALKDRRFGVYNTY